MNQEEATRWLTAMTLPVGEIVVDADPAMFGHRISELDFSPEDLALIQALRRLVESRNGSGIETTIVLSGSAAQLKN